jgi:hypothetical protein
LEYLGYAEQNRQEWELRGKAMVETMSREIQVKLRHAEKQQGQAAASSSF